MWGPHAGLCIEALFGAGADVNAAEFAGFGGIEHGVGKVAPGVEGGLLALDILDASAMVRLG